MARVQEGSGEREQGHGGELFSVRRLIDLGVAAAPPPPARQRPCLSVATLVTREDGHGAVLGGVDEIDVSAAKLAAWTLDGHANRRSV